MNKQIENKMVALEAQMDAVLFRRNIYGEEEQQGMGAGGALKVGAGLGALGAGAYGAKVADQAIMRKYSMLPGVGRGDAYRNAGMDAMNAAKGYGASAKKAGQAGMAAGTNAFYANASKGGGMMRGLFGGIRKGLRVASGGRIRLSEIVGRVNRLIELAEVRINEKGQRSDQNLRRSIPGFLVNIGGGAGAVGNASRFTQENEIYRKRDAAGHSLVGGLAAMPVGIAGGAIASRMRTPGAMLATAIGGTLGATGVGYGVSRAMGERSLDKRKRNASLARLQAAQQG
jgi:hypothetical protein